jgi:penicillin-binding protein 2
LKEVRPVPSIGPFEARQAQTFVPRDQSRPNPKIVPTTAENHQMVVDGMWEVVNDSGTGRGIKMENFELAGKTGTAQVVGLGKDVGENKDHSWFVSYAPAYKPEIAMIALIENVGFGGRFAAPSSRALYDVYYNKTRSGEVRGQRSEVSEELESAAAPAQPSRESRERRERIQNNSID